mmetsp:Transcript_6629/g.14447  ORF Transcript_6629/g.14447 Transcript_6629/m.14447 type:complete len:382 (+) Transcript_6629:63-1208(+)
MPPADLRRRLTVAGVDPPPAGAVPSVPGGGALKFKLEEHGLHNYFSKEALPEGKKAAFVTSSTDKDRNRRRSFMEKDSEVLTPPEFSDKDSLKTWLSTRGIAWSCRKGLKPESPNQDSFSVLMIEDQFAIYSIFDGHGPQGHDISEYVHRVVLRLFVSHPKRETDPGEALIDAFEQTQEELEKQTNLDAQASGTTCTMAYHDLLKDVVTIAHVGDSRAVIGKRSGKGYVDVRELTVDHKPNLPEERRRIESSKPPGRVVWDGYYNHRVFAQNGEYPGLNMSRAIGDIVAHKEAGLTARPDVQVIDLATERAGCDGVTLIIASDGVWEFIKSEDAFSIISSFSAEEVGSAAESLTKQSWDAWMQDSDNEISDDISVVIVHLP